MVRLRGYEPAEKQEAAAVCQLSPAVEEAASQARLEMDVIDDEQDTVICEGGQDLKRLRLVAVFRVC